MQHVRTDRWKTTHAVHTHRSDDRSGHSVRRPPERSLPRSLVRGRKRRGDVRYDCSMRTLEQCVSLIIAGNRGFCNPNPYYRGPEAAPPGVSARDSIIDGASYASAEPSALGLEVPPTLVARADE